jgi:hypothetical protein
VTNDYRQRGFFSSVSDRWILPSGGFVQSLFSLKRLDSQLFPEDGQPGVMTLFPEENSGSFFATQDRNTWLYNGLKLSISAQCILAAAISLRLAMLSPVPPTMAR